MAYKTKELFDEAIKHIREKKLFFVEDVIGFLPCSKPTFYDHFKVDSDEFNLIKDELEKNRISTKTSMRKKWYDSDNPTLQIALMKLISTDEERRKISNTYIDKTEFNANSDGSVFTITRKLITDESSDSVE